MPASGFDLAPRIAPRDDSDWSVASSNVRLSPEARLDLTFEPSGTTGYEDLARGGSLEIMSTQVDVASLADIV